MQMQVALIVRSNSKNSVDEDVLQMLRISK
jgi:hypothetical protein